MTQPSSDPRKYLESLLIRGETVRWSGGSEPGRALAGLRAGRLAVLLPIGFGTIALGIAATLSLMRPAEGFAADQTPLAMALFGSLVLAFGLGRYALQARAAARARGRFFAVTDRRVIAVDGATVRMVSPLALRGVMALPSAEDFGEVHVFHRPEGLDTRADDVTLVMEDVAAIAQACRAVEALARSHGVDISDDAD